MSNWLDSWNRTTQQGSRNANGLAGTDGSDELGILEDDDAWSVSPPAPDAELTAFRPSLSLQRTRFSIELPNASIATVDIDLVAGNASLYLDGRHERTSRMPVRFAVGSDCIEVVAGRYGMRKIHWIGADGSQRRLEPVQGTPEFWRARLARRHPRISRALSLCAVIVLTVNLVLLAPQALELITELPLWSDRYAPLHSPLDLPAWTNSALTVTAGLAAIERALTFRHHRLLDVDTDGIEA
ncbi:hypothetical protein HQO83_17230 [Rhodococcus fascians]|nr:hypothetical protein [Rhodococcus fascians]